MANRKTIIRVDGNSSIGLGHIYRGLALAEILKESFAVELITRKTTTISPIQDAGFDYTTIPDEIAFCDEPSWFKKQYDTDTIIVLDGYDFNEIYQEKIKTLNYKLVYIDDLAQGIQKADIVINHCPGINESDYITEKYTSLALGLNYALLRKPFIEFDRLNVKPKNKIKNIFISFGGADVYDFSYKATTTILNLDFIESVNVVLGAAYKNKAIFKLINSKLKIHKNLSAHQIFNLMRDSDLAITPASTTSIELASLGIPMILGYFMENQKRIYTGFNEKFLVTGIEDFKNYDFSNLNGIIRSINNQNKLQEQSTILLNSFKELSSKNILRMFEFDSMVLRNAKETDMAFVFNLSNELLVRSNSYSTHKIELVTHKIWFKSQLKNKAVLFYIIEIENKAVGQIRFDIKKEYAVISISISNKYRGKGLALKSLRLSVIKYFKQYQIPIYAYIKKSNTSSVNLFKKVGFSFFKEKLIKGINSFIYIKKYENREF